MGQCLNAPNSHWPTPTLRHLQLHRPDVYFALLAVCQRDPLKHLCLCRIAVNRLSQSLHRQFVGDYHRQLADHLPGVRRHQCRPDDLVRHRVAAVCTTCKKAAEAAMNFGSLIRMNMPFVRETALRVSRRGSSRR
jgi:hypothetical protein